jgi:hypothetical protein
MKLGAIAGMPAQGAHSLGQNEPSNMSTAAAAFPESSHRGPWLRAQTISWNARSVRTDMHLKFSRLRPQTCRANSACCCQMNTDK